jgi:MmyB-like transcription regulator ligand binding domain
LRFLHGDRQAERFGERATHDFAFDAAADLRAATGRYPNDPAIAELVADLCAGSEEFAKIWSFHDVSRQQSMCQTIYHPYVGRIDVICEVLVVPEHDQRVVLYTTEPGSSSEQAMRLLGVVGTQTMTEA